MPTNRWTFSVTQNGLVVASGDAPTREDAIREASHYGMIYGQDGPCSWHVAQEKEAEDAD